MNGPLLYGVLIFSAVMITFIALFQASTAKDPVEKRLEQYGRAAEQLDEPEAEVRQRPKWPLMTRLMNGFGMGPRLALALARADLPLTAAEFGVIVLLVGSVAFMLGFLRGGPLLGLALVAVCAVVPNVYLNMRAKKRQGAFTQQLPDVLTMMVGSLRAGFGLSQALEVLVSQFPPPASTEFGRVTRAIGLGIPVQKALSDMADRIGTDDVGLVVTAINVQYEMGGNLAQTLEIISETIRDRIRLLREVQVMTSQQRLTGMILAALPVALAILLSIINPTYMQPLLQPGITRLLLMGAVVMQVLGFLAMSWVLKIEV